MPLEMFTSIWTNGFISGLSVGVGGMTALLALALTLGLILTRK